VSSEISHWADDSRKPSVMSQSLLFIGECMMELRKGSADKLEYSFAGDAYNSAVYAKRWCAEHQVSFFSARGKDQFSEMMQLRWQSEGIDSALVKVSEHRVSGIYAIATDSDGERQFSYWRDNSAATEMMTLLERSGQGDEFPDFDCVFFSGISLGILSDDCKQRLLDLLSRLRKRGAKIAFDPNYRESLWRDQDHARHWILRAYQCCDIAFPGLEEHQILFAHNSLDEVHQCLVGQGVDECVIKAGEEGVFVFANGVACGHEPFQSAPKQVDSTAAGDSFSGTYLAARLGGSTLSRAIEMGAKVARIVVQHEGAIVNIDA